MLFYNFQSENNVNYPSAVPAANVNPFHPIQLTDSLSLGKFEIFFQLVLLTSVHTFTYLSNEHDAR